MYLLRAADEVVDYDSFLAYLKDFWNVMDLMNILCFLAVIGLRAAWMLRASQISFEAGEGDVDDAETDKYFKMRYTTQMYRLGKSFFAMGVLINFLKSFKFISVNPKLGVFTSTLKHACGEMIYLCFVLFVIMAGYGIAFHMIFGADLLARTATCPTRSSPCSCSCSATSTPTSSS